MPSPFPGMDPYLEAPDIWPDVHNSLAGEIRAALNERLPAPYYARVEMRQEVGITDTPRSGRRTVSDVIVGGRRATPPPGPRTETAVRVSLTRPVMMRIEYPPFRHTYVEIRDPTPDHELITLIEIVSPSNKRPGPDRRSYEAKQREILDSTASLIEIDLLRSGRRVLAYSTLEERIDELEPPPDYLVLLNRAWERGTDTEDFDVYPVRLTQALPCIAVPLRESEEEVPLDLQAAFTRVYDTGPYPRLLYYAVPPVPPLDETRNRWLERLLRQAGLRPARRRK
jgi:Protein of unknown function (DUF4058)